MKKLAALIVTLCTVNALADVVLMPGQSVWVGGQNVSCSGGGGYPQPYPPQPQPLPPAPKFPVTVSINRPCLESITPRDGKSVMKAAESCASAQQQRDLRGFQNCTKVRARIDEQLAARVIAQANTIIYQEQKERVRDASAETVFMCERVNYGF